ncbi:pyridoxamine 5'-phosphate oxidase family protein [Phytomonospora sp. NPDC050363]|uniref:pyridoxamine 5'-phosphate oxidase family protein n=1 Tax=Phytomonospora sp. NPDC050363 TaxID=3155642 RepID=UPI00340A52B4
MTYPRTDRTTSLRVPEKLGYDVEAANAILDEAHVCHVGYVAADGLPRVLPTVHARLGDVLYVHGSTGSRAMLEGRGDGLDVCVTVTLLDGLIYSRAWFHHSANYRCVIAHGKARLVSDAEEKWTALERIVDTYGDGRAAASRPPTPKELAQTAVLALPLTEVSVKVRTGGPKDEPEDLDLPYWAGVVPLSLTPGAPVADEGVTAAPPAHLARAGATVQS